MYLSMIVEVTGLAVWIPVVLEQEGRGIVIDWNNEEDTLRQVLAQPCVAGGTVGLAVLRPAEAVTDSR